MGCMREAGCVVRGVATQSSVFSPNGASQGSPGHRPGERRFDLANSPEGAVQACGWDGGRGWVALSGLGCRCMGPDRRALPWAGLGYPFGARIKLETENLELPTPSRLGGLEHGESLDEIQRTAKDRVADDLGRFGGRRGRNVGDGDPLIDRATLADEVSLGDAAPDLDRADDLVGGGRVGRTARDGGVGIRKVGAFLLGSDPDGDVRLDAVGTEDLVLAGTDAGGGQPEATAIGEGEFLIDGGLAGGAVADDESDVGGTQGGGEGFGGTVGLLVDEDGDGKVEGGFLGGTPDDAFAPVQDGGFGSDEQVGGVGGARVIGSTRKPEVEDQATGSADEVGVTEDCGQLGTEAKADLSDADVEAAGIEDPFVGDGCRVAFLVQGLVGFEDATLDALEKCLRGDRVEFGLGEVPDVFAEEVAQFVERGQGGRGRRVRTQVKGGGEDQGAGCDASKHAAQCMDGIRSLGNGGELEV